MYSIKNCILCDKVSMQAQLPVNIREMISTLPTRERRSKARLLPNRYDLQFLPMRIICCMGKETKMWNVNLQLLLHLWIQLQSLEAWKRTMSISVTKWRWPYQVLKARLHSFHKQYKPWRFTKLCNRTSRMTRLLLWLNKLLVFIFHASLMSITTSPYNFKLFFPKIKAFNKELTRKNTSSSEISQFV